MIGKRIRELRTELRLTQTEFGKRLSISRDVVGSFEYNRVIPRESFLELMCHVFKVNKEWLVNGTGEMFDTINKDISEATDILNTLTPSFRALALRQLREMLIFQNSEEQKTE